MANAGVIQILLAALTVGHFSDTIARFVALASLMPSSPGSIIFVTMATDVGGFLTFLGLSTLLWHHLRGRR